MAARTWADASGNSVLTKTIPKSDAKFKLFRNDLMNVA